MCLTVNTKVHKTMDNHTGYPKPLIARKDLTVYKVIRWNNESIWQKFTYRPNTLYTNNYKFLLAIWHCRWDKRYFVDDGYHSYSTKKRAILQDQTHINAKVVEFIVPKGAKYYRGTNGDIVSESIVSGSLKEISCV